MNQSFAGQTIDLDNPRAELALNADFAVRLVEYLESKLDSHLANQTQGFPQRRVAIACQIVEGLDALGIPHITAELNQRALDWLEKLPFADQLAAEEKTAARFHPSRFKTLAQMGRLDQETAALREFRQLSKQVDLRDGILHDTLISAPILATMIWLDAMSYLLDRGWDAGAYERQYKNSCQLLKRLYNEWLTPQEFKRKTNGMHPHARRSGEISKVQLQNPGDASYALDLLLRHHDIMPKDPSACKGKDRLLKALKNRKRGDWRNHGELYCGIQLAAHFDDKEVRQNVDELITELRATFEDGYPPDQELPLAALSLRVIGARYGAELAGEIHRAHWRAHHTQKQKEIETQDKEHRTALKKLLRDTFDIEIGAEEELSNSHSGNRVLRVRFGFKSLGVDDTEQTRRADNKELRIILKQGDASELEKAIAMYQELPPALQPLFAEHAQTIPLTNYSPGQPAYLIMRDLAAMEQLSVVFQRYQDIASSPDARRVITQLARQVSLAFSALHDDPQIVSGATNQLERLYLMPMSVSIDQVCETSFPTLRDFVKGGFDADSVKYKPLGYYLNELRKREDKIRPIKLGKIHGDAHSRNLMLDASSQHVKFIDMEYFAADQDYLMDYALLLEDIAFYQYLPHRQNTARLRFDQLNHTLSSSKEQTRNTIQYPPFPPKSEAALLFQRTLLMQLKTFADSIGDGNWKIRLWLATAKTLLLLLERQTRSKRRSGTERDTLNLALVIYAEAIRLLDEAVVSLTLGTLPELPFTGARVAPHAMNDRALSRQILQLFDELPNVMRQPHPDNQPWLQFFVSKQSQPFAEFHNIAREFPMELILYAPHEHLADPEQLITTRSKDGGFVIPKSRLVNIEAVRALIQQAYDYALNARRE